MFSQGRGRGRCSSQSRSQENERQMSTIDLEVFYLKVVELFRDSSLCYQAILVLNYCGFMEMHILECIKPVCWPCSVHRPQCWGEIAVQQKHIYAICHSSCFKHADLLWTFRHTAALLSCVYFSLWLLPFSGFWIMCLIWSFSKLTQFFFPLSFSFWVV